MLRIGYTPAEVIKKYPALTLAILVGHAGLAYDQGRYWDDFWDELGIPRDQQFENALRMQLTPLLRRFKLAQFPNLDKDYVRLMAMHAGIPGHCLPDLVKVIEQHFVEGREHSAAAIVEWLTEPGKEYRLNAVDVPVRNFIHFGGEFALDVLDRIVEFIDHVVENPGSWDEIELETSTTGLPTLLLGALIDELRDNPIGSDRAGGHRMRRARRPRLAYSITDDQIQVELPYPATGAGEPWRVTFDGDTREVWAERGWGVDGDAHPPTVVPVAAPVREVLVEHRASGTVVTLPVVDKNDPLLLFVEDGRQIPRTAALPQGTILAVYPYDGELLDPINQQPIAPLVEPSTPVGWRGWLAAHIDLSSQQSIQFARGENRTGAARGVRTTASPTFEPSEPVVGLRTVRGMKVYAKRPTVSLPAHPAGHPMDWRVRVRRSGDREWFIDRIQTATNDPTVIDPFDGASRGLIGLYEIVIAGPLGGDLRQQIYLAEGLSVAFDRDFRFPVAAGLLPVTAQIRSDGLLQVDRSLLTFAATDRELPVEVSSGSRRFKLVVTPPHIEMRVDAPGKPARWRTKPQVLSPFELDDHLVIAARVPAAQRVDFALVEAGGRTLQVIEPEVLAENTFQSTTRKFADAAQRKGEGRIVARLTDTHGKLTTVALVHVQKARLCRSIAIEAEQLVFDGLAPGQDIAAWVWPTTAPWRTPATIAITGSKVALPDDLINAGPLLIEVFVDDPWTTITPPGWPDSSAWRVDQPGWVPDPNYARQSLSRFLAGEGAAPAADVTVPEVWAALARLPFDSEDVDTQQLRGALTGSLQANPRSALELLGDSTIPMNQMATLLIRCGLVNQSFAADFTDNELHTNPWVGCMVEIADLPSLYKRRSQVAEERRESITYLADKGGDLLIDVLRVGKARDLNYGLFDKNVERLHALPPAQVERIFESFRLVPAGYLDLDTRVSGNVDAFHSRSEWMRRGWSAEFTAATLRSLEKVKRAGRDLHNVIAARNEALTGVDTVTNPWMLMSLQSLTLAVLARLDAHGMVRHAGLTTDVMEAWARMAELAPKLVFTDLLIAEALVTHAVYGDLIGEIS
ncbi:hypothetical protein FOS14_00080 [Skermania sp. ID1734]|nr:hypothetical protein FOS14_00080 [Skermania sp. ID1734]